MTGTERTASALMQRGLWVQGQREESTSRSEPGGTSQATGRRGPRAMGLAPILQHLSCWGLEPGLEAYQPLAAAPAVLGAGGGSGPGWARALVHLGGCAVLMRPAANVRSSPDRWAKLDTVSCPKLHGAPGYVCVTFPAPPSLMTTAWLAGRALISPGPEGEV